MKTVHKWRALCFAVMMIVSLGWQADAQSYIRYIKPEDFGTKALYADSVLTSITLPRGVSKLSNYYKFNVAAFELFQVLENPDIELMQVWVCGSASPDGLWADNVKLSKARTDNAVEYLKSVMDIPDYMIHAESLDEDWDKLAELVLASDLPFKYEILYIIRTKEWGERKTALQKLDGGSVWKILEKDFFPQLRCVRFAIFCKWDPSKPYLSEPVRTAASFPMQPEFVDEPEEQLPLEEPVFTERELPANADTVYVRDTVVIIKETVIKEQTAPVQVTPTPYVQEVSEVVRKQKEVKYWDTPWMMGFKTNLIGDALVVPTLGVEFQIARKASLDLQGWYTNYNIFNPEDQNTNVYGISPEIRWWIGDRTMRKGSFVGLHARCAWYTLQWTDGLLYQNAPEDIWEGNYHNSGNAHPAWSAGLTYGYSLGLGRKAAWGLEFVLGIGYAKYTQNTAAFNNGIWELVEFQDNNHFGITRAGVNLTYRFSLRRVDPSYYDNY